MEKEAETSELVVLDSSIFIDFLREHPPSIGFFKKISPSKNNFIFSVITKTELISGNSCNDFAIKSKILHMLGSFTQIEVNSSIAVLAGDICRENDLAIPDAIIAATALLNKSSLFTRNIKDFQDLEKRGLKVKSPY